MIVDVHAHLGKWPYPIAPVSAEDEVAAMRRYGIDYALVSSSLAIYYDFVEGNRELAGAIRDHPELLGYVTVNLNYPAESLTEIDRYIVPGSRFVGIKVHQESNQHAFNTPEGMQIARAAEAHRVPILIHTFGSAVESPWNVVPAALAHPTVPMILGHMGGPAWWEGCRAAREAGNLYLEICSTYTDPAKVRAGFAAAGPERVLFGTDQALFDPAHMLGAVADADLSVDETIQLMGGNACRLFNLPHKET